MRNSVKRLNPDVHVSSSGRKYTSFELGKLSRVSRGGYKLEGPVFATSGLDRTGMHRVLDDLLDRLDEAQNA
jgi:hypothetical protein